MIDFTTSAACGRWLALPIELVDSITHLANMTCKDHEHPLVKVTFKRPQGTNNETAFLLELVSQLQTKLSHAQSDARTRAACGRLTGSAARMSASDCVIAHMPRGLEICCTVERPDGSLEVECGGIV